MKTAWFLEVSQAPVGLQTQYIRVKTRPYHFFLPRKAFRTEQEALSEAASIVKAGVYAKIERGSPLCSLHPAYGHWGPTQGTTSHYITSFDKEMTNVPRSLVGMQ